MPAPPEVTALRETLQRALEAARATSAPRWIVETLDACASELDALAQATRAEVVAATARAQTALELWRASSGEPLRR
jgi:hypothetical protein